MTEHVDVEAQAVLCFENIGAILTEAGMSFADVEKAIAELSVEIGALKQRFTIASRLNDAALNFQERIIEANAVRGIQNWQGISLDLS